MNKFVLKRTAMKLCDDVVDCVTFLFIALRLIVCVVGIVAIMFSFAISFGDWIMDDYTTITMYARCVNVVTIIVGVAFWVRSRYLSSVQEIQ